MYNAPILFSTRWQARGNTIDPSILFWIYTTAVLLFAFFNGFNNSGALIAAPISSRAAEPRLALTVALVAEFSGPFLFGVAVASTLGQDLIRRDALSLTVLLAAIVSAMVWNIVTYLVGFPSSSANALIGGMIGSAIVSHGVSILIPTGVVKVVASLLLSPALGLVSGFVAIKVLLWLVEAAPPSVNNVFKGLQLFTTAAMGLSHGTNDGQKSMGLITIGLVVLGRQTDFVVPLWVTFACALALTLGVSAGGVRVIRTLGGKIYRLRPIHGFASQLMTSAVVLGAALVGGPVSTMQVVGTTIMGVGSGERIRAVRWGMATQIITAWFVTIPVVAAASGALYLILRTWIGP